MIIGKRDINSVNLSKLVDFDFVIILILLEKKLEDHQLNQQANITN